MMMPDDHVRAVVNAVASGADLVVGQVKGPGLFPRLKTRDDEICAFASRLDISRQLREVTFVRLSCDNRNGTRHAQRCTGLPPSIVGTHRCDSGSIVACFPPNWKYACIGEHRNA